MNPNLSGQWSEGEIKKIVSNSHWENTVHTGFYNIKMHHADWNAFYISTDAWREAIREKNTETTSSTALNYTAGLFGKNSYQLLVHS